VELSISAATDSNTRIVPDRKRTSTLTWKEGLPVPGNYGAIKSAENGSINELEKNAGISI